MEAKALEQRLRERPGDEATWGAYGGRLRDQGDARGELIRLEHRHAHARPADRDDLRRRIDLLVEEHQEQWDAELPPGVTVVTGRHGFAVKVAVAWSDQAPALIGQAIRGRLVTGLRIRPGAEAEDADADYYGDEPDFDENDMPLPPPPHDARALADLDLGGLTELDLAYFRIGDAGAEALAAATSDGRIETLDLRYCGVGDAGVAALCASPAFGEVRRLHLQSNRLTAEGVRALAGFERLEELDLRYNRIGPDGARALVEAPFAGSLKRLFLYGHDVEDAGVQILANAPQLPSALRSFWRSV
ncbi:hypothetical protein MTP10_26665 [Nonomuraea sp. 3-1Str]|uniref:hypothetical protein n=1 Tax=Nonomuraea sp. 3-1Str TaxID=2929801 RepID=UPI0028590FFB|nr:hypothetical protein [Nonomuraea sp. 3-1Str]MDR8412306.1 hypothetical protein [Nonomuraea sp. 3-1Str]